MTAAMLEQRRETELRWEAEELQVRLRFWNLVKSFPSLAPWAANVAVDEKFNALKFEKWANGPCPGHGALAAARFVLSVWNPPTKWKCGAFDLHDSLSCWDGRHQEAFLRWCAEPWWP